MGHNSALVPEDLESVSTRSPSSTSTLRSPAPRIQSLHHDTLSANAGLQFSGVPSAEEAQRIGGIFAKAEASMGSTRSVGLARFVP